MPAVQLRQYQQEGVDAIRAAMRKRRRILYVAPTGSGKTVVFSHIAEIVWSTGGSVYLMAHRIEIVQQISAGLRANGVRHGVIAPGYPETSWPVQVCMVQTLAHRIDRLRRPRLLIIDEAHHAVAGSYRKITDAWEAQAVAEELRGLKALRVYQLLVTATPWRLDGSGLGDVADEMIVGPSVRELTDLGHLARFNYFAPPVVANLSQLKTRAGDYISAEVAAAMDQRGVTGDAERHYRQHLNGAPALAFCATVEHAQHVAAQFAAMGWQAAAVDGKMSAQDRRWNLEGIGNGGLNLLATCDLVSEGTDIPVVQGALLLRLTASLVIYLQQCGRVLRPKKDGSRAIILDHVGNVVRNGGLPDAERVWSLTASPKRGQAASVRTCADCYLAFPPAPRCPNCGLEVARGVGSGGGRGKLEITAGELTKVEQLAVKPLKELLKKASTYEALKAIADARGYGHRWITIQLHMKAKARGRFRGGARA